MKKVVIILLSLLIAVYLVFVFAMKRNPEGPDTMCKGVKIEIAQEGDGGFLTVDDVRNILTVDQLNPQGRMMSEVNARMIEEKLASKDLVESAECYKAQDGMVHVIIKQRIPVIRVMSENGDDYFLDSSGKRMPRTDYSCNLLIATGHISMKYGEKVLGPVANILRKDEFWNDQIVQLNVLGDGTIEMVPRVGDHIIYIGKPENLRAKLDRLWKFYVYGLNQAGWNRYSRINVEFDNQIICKRK
ncbi:MAG: cell division protein FtsQ [Prevotella sp.]|nr:cell division protein FtsQ [Prevotella sp.]